MRNENIIIRRRATLVPDYALLEGLGDAHRLVRTLVDSGVPRGRARALVDGACRRLRRGSGLGDEEFTGPLPDKLTEVQNKAAAVQADHKRLIDQLPGATGDADRMRIRNAVEALYGDWTDYAVGAAGGRAPFQWNRTDPVEAILIAVREDLRNTADLLAANKAQQVLAKQIAAIMPRPGLPKLKIEIPWYVWAGGAVAVAAWVKGLLS